MNSIVLIAAFLLIGANAYGDILSSCPKTMRAIAFEKDRNQIDNLIAVSKQVPWESIKWNEMAIYLDPGRPLTNGEGTVSRQHLLRIFGLDDHPPLQITPEQINGLRILLRDLAKIALDPELMKAARSRLQAEVPEAFEEVSDVENWNSPKQPLTRALLLYQFVTRKICPYYSENPELAAMWALSNSRVKPNIFGPRHKTTGFFNSVKVISKQALRELWRSATGQIQAKDGWDRTIVALYRYGFNGTEVAPAAVYDLLTPIALAAKFRKLTHKPTDWGLGHLSDLPETFQERAMEEMRLYGTTFTLPDGTVISGVDWKFMLRAREVAQSLIPIRGVNAMEQSLDERLTELYAVMEKRFGKSFTIAYRAAVERGVSEFWKELQTSRLIIRDLFTNLDHNYYAILDFQKKLNELEKKLSEFAGDFQDLPPSERERVGRQALMLERMDLEEKLQAKIDSYADHFIKARAVASLLNMTLDPRLVEIYHNVPRIHRAVAAKMRAAEAHYYRMTQEQLKDAQKQLAKTIAANADQLLAALGSSQSLPFQILAQVGRTGAVSQFAASTPGKMSLWGTGGVAISTAAIYAILNVFQSRSTAAAPAATIPQVTDPSQPDLSSSDFEKLIAFLVDSGLNEADQDYIEEFLDTYTQYNWAEYPELKQWLDHIHKVGFYESKAKPGRTIELAKMIRAVRIARKQLFDTFRVEYVSTTQPSNLPDIKTSASTQPTATSNQPHPQR